MDDYGTVFFEAGQLQIGVGRDLRVWAAINLACGNPEHDDDKEGLEWRWVVPPETLQLVLREWKRAQDVDRIQLANSADGRALRVMMHERVALAARLVGDLAGPPLCPACAARGGK